MNKFSKTQQMLFSLIGDPKINKKLKKNLIESLDTKNIDLICEFVLNVFNKNVPMCNDSYKSLKPQAKYCRKLLNKKLNLKEKKIYTSEFIFMHLLNAKPFDIPF